MLPEGATMKKRKRHLDAGREARRRARKTGLAPGATRVIEDKRKKKEKHKKGWMEEEN
jgi:hypothetical protein